MRNLDKRLKEIIDFYFENVRVIFNATDSMLVLFSQKAQL